MKTLSQIERNNPSAFEKKINILDILRLSRKTIFTERKNPISMLQAGMSTVEIARQLGTSARAIKRLLKRYNTTWETND